MGRFSSVSRLASRVALSGLVILAAASPGVAAARGRTCRLEQDAPATSDSVRRKTAHALDAEPLLGPGFLVVPNTGAALGCGPRAVAETALTNLVEDVLEAAALDPELVVVFGSAYAGCDDIFYVPLANDVEGIGYARTRGADVFDDTPDRALEGIAFLNDVPYWQENQSEYETAFLHELGHRWSGRLHARTAARELDLTGREDAHWSYFFASGGSPLEGNVFVQDPLRTDTPLHPTAYPPLDLYAMGLLDPRDVGPLGFVDDGAADGLDCRGGAVTASSGPQSCEPKDVRGDWIEFGIDDVVRAEGARSPSFEDEVAAPSVVHLLLVAPGDPFSNEECESFSARVRSNFERFRSATGDRLALVDGASDGTSCASLVERFSAESRTSGCAFTAGPGASSAPWGFLVALLAARARRRRPDSTP